MSSCLREFDSKCCHPPLIFHVCILLLTGLQKNSLLFSSDLFLITECWSTRPFDFKSVSKIRLLVIVCFIAEALLIAERWLEVCVAEMVYIEPVWDNKIQEAINRDLVSYLM